MTICGSSLVDASSALVADDQLVRPYHGETKSGCEEAHSSRQLILVKLQLLDMLGLHGVHAYCELLQGSKASQLA